MLSFFNQFNLPKVLYDAPDEKTGGEDKQENEKNQSNSEVEEKKYSDKELNDIIAKQKAKWEKSTAQVKDNKEKQDDEDVQQEETQEIENPFVEKYVQAEVKFAMVQSGIDAKKVNRAVRLIDTKEVVNEEGELDSEKLDTEIADLLKEFPELGNQKDNSGINKIGADNKSDKGNSEDLIAQAFGNKK